jgi:hypothetical protein
MANIKNNAAQIEFNKKYVSSSELQRELSVTRSAIMYARRRNQLPEPIVVNEGQLCLWERAVLKPYLDKWKEDRGMNRGPLK